MDDDNPEKPDTPASGLVFVLSGPSGVGKSTLIERLKHDHFPITHCVTATTRPRRQGEEHGVHYYFLTEAQYDALLDSRYQNLLKSLPGGSFEIGAWWEIPQPLVETHALLPLEWVCEISVVRGDEPFNSLGGNGGIGEVGPLEGFCG